MPPRFLPNWPSYNLENKGLVVSLTSVDGKINEIVRYGKTAAGVQRYQCRDCGKSFTATKGTLIYRKQTPCQEIEETLALLAEGMRISSISRVKGVKEDTILSWLREAAEHAEPIEAVVLDRYRLAVYAGGQAA